MEWCKYLIIGKYSYEKGREQLVGHFSFICFRFRTWERDIVGSNELGSAYDITRHFGHQALGTSLETLHIWTLSTCGASCLPYKEVQLPWATMIQQIQQKPVKPVWAVNLTIWLVHSLATVLFLWTQHTSPICYCAFKNCPRYNRHNRALPRASRLTSGLAPTKKNTKNWTLSNRLNLTTWLSPFKKQEYPAKSEYLKSSGCW